MGYLGAPGIKASFLKALGDHKQDFLLQGMVILTSILNPNMRGLAANKATTDPDSETTDPDSETTDPDSETADPDSETTDPDSETTDPDSDRPCPNSP